MHSRIFSWDEWKDLLIATFPPKRDLHSLLIKMLNFKPSDAADLYEYCHSKLALINDLHLTLPDKDKIHLIMGAITDNHIRFSVETSGIINPSLLANYLRTYSDPTEIKTPKAISPQKHLAGTVATLPYAADKRRCYVCNQQGHIRSACPRNTARNSGSTKFNKRCAIDYNVNLIHNGDTNKNFF